MTSLRTRDRLIQRLYDQGICDHKVIDCMRSIPRHIFVDEALSHRAYEDTALPIGHSQTLSQPFIVARMTEALLAGGHEPKKVLEVGTGSGYQTVVLAGLVEQVFTVERIRPLQAKARERFRILGIRNVLCRHSDGGMGWPDKGEFDGIVVTAAPETVPDSLLQQLAVGGRMIIPVGGTEQHLYRITRTETGYERDYLEPVRFVPLLGGVIR
ncbi:protein-L-isoaspartate(D-aspartate) O-methyltransferase [Sansalvadorimonas sp. 2012CJ34-2]|uniref:Protein-L-isoaspartate O-methyltransferase n=1 Tax=Parendozoicomonas callyspongiae TaxID=2942213 RepID=A0ABT0PDB9_9GAMM|nr:protein-L-isoaspartate(D-aspartate) O-methyltransferase [Sansalvadorimonas sp. 2012CJ34-2]MCL6269303.1 protein-L-isoaspartate(D-aspartate) O-methyltransferase [Sansalvadorimonas sp. 2012CJ34-2]